MEIININIALFSFKPHNPTGPLLLQRRGRGTELPGRAHEAAELRDVPIGWAETGGWLD